MLEESFATSQVCRIEVLGYHLITTTHKQLLTEMFSAVKMIPMTVPIVERAIQLRQQRRMSLGDAIVAATALERDLILWTRNVKDFTWIPDLVVHDPFGAAYPA
jgi:hypothetical protein